MKRRLSITLILLFVNVWAYGQWDKTNGGNATITQTITDGDTTNAPSGDAINDALAGKLSTVCTGTMINPITTAPIGDCLVAGEGYWVDGLLYDPTTDLITITGSGIAAVNSNPDTFTDTDNQLAVIKIGMRVKGEGFTATADNGTFTAAADATAGSVTLIATDALTAEAAGAARTLYVYNHYKVRRTPEGGWVKLEDERGVISVASYNTVETEYLPISYAIDGAAAPDALATVTSGTDKVNARTFAGDSTEDVLIPWKIPLDIDAAAGIKYRVLMVVTAATAPSNEGISFDMSGFSVTDGDALDGTLGTVMESNLTGRSDPQYDGIATGWSSAMTSTHITDLTAGETVILKLERDHDDADDTYAQLIGVVGVEVKYVRKHDTTF